MKIRGDPQNPLIQQHVAHSNCCLGIPHVPTLCLRKPRMSIQPTKIRIKSTICKRQKATQLDDHKPSSTIPSLFQTFSWFTSPLIGCVVPEGNHGGFPPMSLRHQPHVAELRIPQRSAEQLEEVQLCGVVLVQRTSLLSDEWLGWIETWRCHGRGSILGSWHLASPGATCHTGPQNSAATLLFSLGHNCALRRK